jgi:hypothetical protein
MKLVLLSGAGLSATSGVPTYVDVVNQDLYKEFLSTDNPDVLSTAELIKQKFDSYTPSTVHHQCVKIGKVCDSLGIEFRHFTLNVDDLIEKAGGEAEHLYGCINEPQTMVDFRFEPRYNIDYLDWESGDLLVFLGISDNGIPLAHLESIVLSAEGTVHHYNLDESNILSGLQIIGDLADTFSSTSITTYIPFDFIELDYGDSNIVHVTDFELSNQVYEVFFTPYELRTMDDNEYKEIENVTGIPIDQNNFEIKFDLKSNRENENRGSYTRPRANFSLQEMHVLGDLILSAASSHFATYEVSLYTASAQYPSLNSYYTKLARQAQSRINCTSWCQIGEQRSNYAFKF